MKYLTNTLLSVLFAVLTSCIFGGEEDNFVHVEQTANPAYKNNILYSFNSSSFSPLVDTLWLYSSAYLRLYGPGLYDFEISIDNQVVRNFGSADVNSDFYLQRGNRPAGKYSLKIVQRSKSGTGSLADNAGLEFAEHSSSYVLIIDDNTFEPQITSMDFKDGTVEIKWKKYLLGDFQEYILSVYSSWTEYVPYKKFVFTKKETTVFLDTTYARSVQYTISVKRGNEIVSSQRYNFYSTYTSEFRLEKGDAPNTLRLYWKPPIFYKNVASYYLYPYGAGQPPIVTDIPPDAEYAEFQSTHKFGQVKSYSFGFKAHGGDENSNSEAITLGKKVKPYHQLDYNESLSSYFLLFDNDPQYNHVDGLYRLSSDFKTVDSLVVFTSAAVIAVSPDGSNAHLLRGTTITTVDPLNLQSNSSITLADIELPGLTIEVEGNKNNFAVTNSNYLLLRTTSQKVLIINMDTHALVFQVAANGPTHLSSNHQYFVNGSTLYEFSGGTYIEKGTLPYAPAYIQFLNESTSQVVVGTNNSVAVFDCDSFTEVFSKNFASGITPFHYDQFNQSVNFIKTGVLVEMKLDDLMEEPIDVYIPSSAYFIEGGKLFYRYSGYVLENYH